MSLHSIALQVMKKCDTNGKIEKHSAIKNGRLLVEKDESALAQVIADGLWREISSIARRTLRMAEAEEERQGSLPFASKLRSRYIIDENGTTLKETSYLSRLEFRRLINIRFAQVQRDMDHLGALRVINDALSPIWDAHPDLLFWEAERLYIESRNAA